MQIINKIQSDMISIHAQKMQVKFKQISFRSQAAQELNKTQKKIFAICYIPGQRSCLSKKRRK